MKRRRFIRASRRAADRDDLVAAYWAWRRECAAVRAAYGRWVHAATSEACGAAAAYRAALDREERAAHIYARFLSRPQHRRGPDIGLHLAEIAAPFGA
jgi:hypothetical protein